MARRVRRAEGTLLIARAEASFAEGRFDDVLALTRALVPETTRLERANLKRIRARALIETTRSAEAVQLLEEARLIYREDHALELEARATFDLARAHARLRAIGEAKGLALEAERRLQAGVVVDRSLELEIHRFLVGIYLAEEDDASAELRARRALAVANDVADPRATARLYMSLAILRERLGEEEAATSYAQRALALYAHVRDKLEVAETWNTLGWLYIKQRRFRQAEGALNEAERLGAEVRHPSLARVLALNRAEMAMAQGDPHAAVDLAKVAAVGAEGRVEAGAALMLARATAATKAPVEEIDRAFGAALHAFTDQPPASLARFHQEYAEALAARGRQARAFEHARLAIEALAPSLRAERLRRAVAAQHLESSLDLPHHAERPGRYSRLLSAAAAILLNRAADAVIAKAVAATLAGSILLLSWLLTR